MESFTSSDFRRLVTISASVLLVAEIVRLTSGFEWPIPLKMVIAFVVVLIVEVCLDADSWQDW